MTALSDGELLYHASYTEVKNIDLSYCKKGLDFGRGFYVTSSYLQAYNYVIQAVKKHNFQISKGEKFIEPENGYINIYRFHNDSNISMHFFAEADVDWLHFVSSNRDNSLFPELLRKLDMIDVIGGKIADDQTRRTLIDYISGAYGKPGTARADQFALDMLLPNRRKDQYCFRTENGIHSLEFIRGEKYGSISRPKD